MTLRIGSRGSQLALWQANWVKQQLEAAGHACSITIIKTTGDRILDIPLSEVGAKGLFTKEIEDALLDGAIDLAVHSLKDLPADLPPGLTIAAYPAREDPRDAIVGARLAQLPEGAKIGTSSLRRKAQLLALRPDLQIETIRGNVDTRLRKQREGLYDAIVLAAAGLKRLGLEDAIAEYFEADVMCHAVGQGALAVETRADGGPAHTLCAALNHPPTFWAVTAERSVLAALGGGCKVPVAASASLSDNRLELTALVASPDGKTLLRRHGSAAGAEAAALGRRLGEELLNAGAREILAAVYGSTPNLSRWEPGKR